MVEFNSGDSFMYVIVFSLNTTFRRESFNERYDLIMREFERNNSIFSIPHFLVFEKQCMYFNVVCVKLLKTFLFYFW